jgi:hypothetical protein
VSPCLRISQAAREAQQQAEREELAEHLAEFDFLGEDGEVLDEQIHQLAVAEVGPS